MMTLYLSRISLLDELAVNFIPEYSMWKARLKGILYQSDMVVNSWFVFWNRYEKATSLGNEEKLVKY